MEAVFVELPPFERHRQRYLDDDEFAALQQLLMSHAQAGDVIPQTGGLRKLRLADSRRGKGKRGGLRIIYYWWDGGAEFWLFAIYGKNEMSDLTWDRRRLLTQLLKAELERRT